MPISRNATYEAVSSEFNPGESEEVLDFNPLAQQLIEEAAADPDSDNPNDDEPSPPAPPLTIWLPLHAIQAALPASMPEQPTIVPKMAIPLKLLFIFSTNWDSPSTGMDYFWQGGVKNLDKEMEAYEMLSAALENNSVESGLDIMIAMASSTTAPWNMYSFWLLLQLTAPIYSL
jgi:hypothetical protein